MKSPNIYVSQQSFLLIWVGWFFWRVGGVVFLAFSLKPLWNLTLFCRSFCVCWEPSRDRKKWNLSSPAMICFSKLASGDLLNQGHNMWHVWQFIRFCHSQGLAWILHKTIIFPEFGLHQSNFIFFSTEYLCYTLPSYSCSFISSLHYC